MSLLSRVDPLNRDLAVEEARRCIDELGARGLFIHSSEECVPGRGPPTSRPRSRARAPVVLATGYYGVSEPLELASSPRRSPMSRWL